AQIHSAPRDAASGLTYIVMPYLGTRTLFDWIVAKNEVDRRDRRSTPFGDLNRQDFVGRSLEMLSDVADGMTYAHRQGVVHGDIKPQNVLVTDDGNAVLLDFNGARIEGRDGLAVYTLPFTAPELLEAVTSSAPEQFILTQATDAYAFGMTIMETLQRRTAAAN